MSKGQAKLSHRQLKEIRDAFNLFDRDHSGSISATELKQVLIALNLKPTDATVRKVMKEMDTDGSGTIEFDEFARAMKGVYERELSDDEMHRAFKCFDTDGSGFITIDEFRSVLRRLIANISEQRIKDILDVIDSDHDGKISYQEFVNMMQNA